MNIFSRKNVINLIILCHCRNFWFDNFSAYHNNTRTPRMVTNTFAMFFFQIVNKTLCTKIKINIKNNIFL